MRWLIALAMATLLLGCEKSRDEAAIKNASEAYAKAFNQRDRNQFAALWSKDATYLNVATQETFQGREAIADYFKSQFQKENAPQIKVSVNSVELEGSDSATETGVVEVSTDKSAYQADYVKENGAWLIQRLSVLPLRAPSSHFEHLKEIEWLAGNWIDDDPNLDMTTEFKWDKNKNFLTQRFNLSVFNHEILEGFQIIGWDPAENRIRSWIFDSDGGFGKGIWEHQDNSWYVMSSFTLPDGRKGSATHIYTKVDEDTYTFAVVSRDIDGTLLPDVAPFKVVRTE